jgi:hypothetical protein
MRDYVVLRRDGPAAYLVGGVVEARDRRAAIEHVAAELRHAGEYVAIPAGAFERFGVALEAPRASVSSRIGGALAEAREAS